MAKTLASFKKLAGSNGYPDPLKYLFGRMKAENQKGNYKAAAELAKFLVPYGYGKIAPVDQETGETVNTVFKLD